MRVDLSGAALTAALVIAVCASGCGSSDSTTSTETTATISKAEFIAKGNAVCVKGEKAQNVAVNAYVKKNGLENKEPTSAQESEIAELILIPNIQSQIDGVTALGAPSGEEERVSAAIEASQQALDKGKANPALFSSDENLFVAAGKQLHALGLIRCAPTN